MTKQNDALVEIFTDGACLGNPGPGGWSAILRYKNYEKEVWGGHPKTTNNRMELTAVIEALQSIKRTCDITVYTDSQYVQKGITEWIYKWERKDFKTRKGDARKNADLWKVLLALSRKHSIRWEWVRGHSGHAENERADNLANNAAYQARKNGEEFKYLEGAPVLVSG